MSEELRLFTVLFTGGIKMKVEAHGYWYDSHSVGTYMLRTNGPDPQDCLKVFRFYKDKSILMDINAQHIESVVCHSTSGDYTICGNCCSVKGLNKFDVAKELDYEQLIKDHNYENWGEINRMVMATGESKQDILDYYKKSQEEYFAKKEKKNGKDISS